MIQLTHGDILKSEVEALVNTVNCMGIMGRGIALQFKKAFPDNFEAYEKICKAEKLHPGMMFVYDLHTFNHPRYIINFPTKRHWKGNSKIEDIHSGLQALIAEVKRLDIKSIAVPPLGCGLGGLSWAQVRPLIEDAFKELPNVVVELYEPAGAPPAAAMAHHADPPKITVGRAALIVLMHRYTEPMLDDEITLLEIQKLMYFMQEAGERLRLNYVKGKYGPYADNLRHVLNHIEGHFITGFGAGGEDPEKVILLMPGACEKAEAFLLQHAETKDRFERVARLIEGFETPFGMELLATVHWVARDNPSSSVEDVVLAVHQWSGRKKAMMKSEHIQIAWQRLKDQQWI